MGGEVARPHGPRLGLGSEGAAIPLPHKLALYAPQAGSGWSLGRHMVVLQFKVLQLASPGK